jgi:hypothetical protein
MVEAAAKPASVRVKIRALSKLILYRSDTDDLITMRA